MDGSYLESNQGDDTLFYQYLNYYVFSRFAWDHAVDVEKILSEPKNALVKQYQKLLKMNNVTLEFTGDAIAELALQAEKKGTGARGLRSLMESLMTDVMYELPKAGITRCVVDASAVRGETPVKLSGDKPRAKSRKKA